MRSRFPRRGIGRLPRLAVVAAVLLIGPVAVQAAAADEQPWSRVLSSMTHGDLDAVQKAVHDLAPNGQVVEQADSLLSEYGEMHEKRRELARADFEKYVDWVKTDLADHEWTRAVETLYSAFEQTDDRDAFRTQSWVEDAVAHAREHAEELRKKGEWVEAFRIYGYLQEIFAPGGQDYRELRKQCRTHILLENSYRPDGEWRDEVRDIDADMAKVALHMVNEQYVKEPDFKVLALSALQRMQLMAATTKLGETFPTMKDAELLEEFTRRIGRLVERVEGQRRSTVNETVGLLDRVVSINADTIRIPQEVIIDEFMEGALEPLDEFSTMIWPADVERFRKDVMGEFGGVGIHISEDDGALKVISPLEDTPAYEAGIQPGDLVVKVNGEATTSMSIDQAVRKITGPPGTKVVLTIRRPGVDREFDMALVRARIKVPTVKGVRRAENGDWDCWADKDLNIAYLRVTGFTDNTVEELATVLSKLSKEKMRALIIDLRFNPGGPLRAAVDMCDLLLPPGRRIVSTRGRDSSSWEQSSRQEDHYTDVPLIVLVNEYSASASEIVAGALQDHQRALIVGERTFGKGSVQNLLPLRADGSARIKLTSAKYYLPNGRCPHREIGATDWGVDPDVVVRLDPKETRKVLLVRNKGDILKGKNQGSLPTDKKFVDELFKPSHNETDDEDITTSRPADGTSSTTKPGEATTQATTGPAPRVDEDNRPEIDPQFQAALLLMRIRMLTQQPFPIEQGTMSARASNR